MKQYKKVVILFIIVFTFLIFVTITNIKGYVGTGHPDFTEVNFINGGKLLASMDEDEINYGRNKIKGFKFWGWKTYYYNVDKKVTYIGKTVFSRVNRTTTAYTVNYTLEETNSLQRSIQVSGSLSAKVVGNIKKINTQVTGEGGVEVVSGNKNTTTFSEETNIKININPFTKVTLRISGEGYVTNATGKYCVFGIPFQRGEWERIDVTTFYYELIEEELE